MSFDVKACLLLEAVNAVLPITKAIEKWQKNLKLIKITILGGSAIVEATNYDVVIKKEVKLLSSFIDDPFCVDGKTLQQVLSNIDKNDRIGLSKEENLKITVLSTSEIYTLPLSDVEKYQTRGFEGFSLVNSFKMDSMDIHDTTKKLLMSIAPKDVRRESLKKVYCELEGMTLKLTTTDGKRLTHIEYNIIPEKETEKKISFYLTDNAIKNLWRLTKTNKKKGGKTYFTIFENDKGRRIIEINGKNDYFQEIKDFGIVVYDNDNTSFVGYGELIKNNRNNIITVNKKDFLRFLKPIIKLKEKDNDNYVAEIESFADGKIKAGANSFAGITISKNMKSIVQGNVKFNINAKLFYEMVDVLNSEEIDIIVNSSYDPIIIKDNNEHFSSNETFLIMPIKPKGGVK